MITALVAAGLLSALDWSDGCRPVAGSEAQLHDVGGEVTGSTLEPDNLGPIGAPPIPARLEGHHFDSQLVFTKFPNGGGQTHTIDYVGSISADGNSIAGRWVIHGDWSGPFQMQRNLAPAVTALDVAATA
ncbi:hypothetical protein [Brevundimonas sp. CEF1]|uniref:hypothetical protein n=1 Tax=Brevundimonas sp. CEF1 TaxID=3442642 RepID=UPI003F5146A7